MLILNISMQPIEDKERELEAKLDKEIKVTLLEKELEENKNAIKVSYLN